MSEKRPPIPLLILEAGLQDGREYWLKNLVEKGYRLLLAQPWEPSWEKPYIEKYVPFSFDKWLEHGLLKLKTFCREERVQGVLCLNEGTVPFANELTQAVGLPVLCRGQAMPFRNKAKMREASRRSLFDQPKSFSVNPSDADFEGKLRSIVETIRFPVVVKPAELMSSLGVLKINAEMQLRDAVMLAGSIDFPGENLRRHYTLSSEVVVEEYVEGYEYSAEAICQRGELLHWSLTKKVKCQKPYFDEVGHIAGPSLARELVSDLDTKLRSLHEVLKVQNAVTHTEILLSNTDMHLVEIGLRPGGDYIPWLHTIAQAFPYWEVAACLSTGREVKGCIRNSIFSSRNAAVFFPFITHSRRKLPDASTLKNLISATGVEIEHWSYESEIAGTRSPNPGLGTERVGSIVFSSSQYDALINVFRNLSEHFPEVELEC